MTHFFDQQSVDGDIVGETTLEDMCHYETARRGVITQQSMRRDKKKKAVQPYYPALSPKLKSYATVLTSKTPIETIMELANVQ